MVNLFSAIIFDISIVLALFANLILLIIYAFIKDYKLKEIFEMTYQGLLETKTVLFVFLLIGMLTGIWRLSGTIAYIIYHGTGLIAPKFFYVGVFLFNSAISLLTGTSLGTASTSGIISMSISTAMNFNPLISGGAILSGCYFGDRSSPMSTSALLVATLTKTDLYENLKNMFRTCVIPLILTLISFQIFNFGSEAEVNYDSLKSIADMFNFNFLLIIPTLSIILLAILKVDIRLNLIISIVLSVIFAMITYEMARENYEDPYKFALDLENSAIMTPLYIPWNITGRSPMELVGGPISAILFSFYHHYIVLVNTIISIIDFKKNK